MKLRSLIYQQQNKFAADICCWDLYLYADLFLDSCCYHLVSLFNFYNSFLYLSNLFLMASQYIVVVGCGRLGSILASRLSSQGNSVVVIDPYESSFSNLSSDFSGFQITGDASEIEILRSAKVDRADCLLAVTDKDNINLMVTQIAKQIFQTSIVLARVFDPAREKIYRDFGIATISPTQLSADAFIANLPNSMIDT